MSKLYITNMFKEVNEYFQMEKNDSSSTDYIVLRSPTVWCSFTNNQIQNRHYTNAEKWRTSWTVTVLWTLISILVTFTCTVGFVETEWFVRENSTMSSTEHRILIYERSSLVYTLGMFNVCYRDLKQTHFHCHRFGVTKFPSSYWQGTCILYGIGCVLQGCGLVLLIFTLIYRGALMRIGAQIVAHSYVLAGFLQTFSLLLYPLILDTHVGRLHCGPESHAYRPHLCRVGWAYVASTAGTLLTFYCPFLAYFSFYRVYDGLPTHDITQSEKVHINPTFVL